MNTHHLIFRNVIYYKSFYCLIAIAVIVAVAVITGSLMVGDSVRSTLIKRVDERLGKTETVVFSRYSYLDDSILKTLEGRGVLLLNGFVSVSGKLIPVTVWGTDDPGIKKGQAKINHALYNEIKSAQIQDIVLRLPSAGMVPLGSMFVTDAYTTSLRLELESIITVEQGGNLNLKNEQTIPFNIFVNRKELAETMDIQGKINVILYDRMILEDEFAAVWDYSISGLKVDIENQITTITSDRIFIQNQVVETLVRYDSAANRIFTYLANSIQKNDNSIPYSFITAVDYYKGEKLNPEEIILSDYAAQRLNVRLNDTISINYFVSKQFKTLIEDSVFLRVAKVVPIADLQNDKTLIADFPGLSNVESCTDWNSDLPINMNLITVEDEEYWEKYKNTPKVIVPYAMLASRWINAFGSATALQTLDTNRLKDFTYEMFDIQLINPRKAGITAAQSGVDFSSLFLSLGFFIIISAVMLMIVPLSEMLFRRRYELNLLKSTGFSNGRILRLILCESTPVLLSAAIVGVIGGLLYTYLVLFLLGNVWQGATHTEGFKAYPHLITIVMGMVSGSVLSWVILYFSIILSLKKRYSTAKGAKDTQREIPLKSRFFLLCEKSLRSLRSLRLKNTQCRTSLPLNTSRLIKTSIFYNKKQTLLSFISLASGVLIVFSVGLNRRSFADSLQIRTGTGGFSLWVETSVPVYHNLQTEEGRDKLGLIDLPNETQIMQLLKYSADDASCLNLNKVVTPNVLGVNMDDLKNSDLVVNQTVNNAQYSAFIDETVLTWNLGKKIGDTIVYVGEKGENIPIVLAGTIQNSIFQGYILIDKTLFSEIWSEISGSEIMLLTVPDDNIDETKALISQALNNYGVRVMTTNERLKMFYSVTDTYLTIFMTLSGLGLLLGIFSFVIVVRKNILARTKEIMLYCSLGFDEKRIFKLLYKENIIIPISAILIGAIGSLIGVSTGFGNASAGLWVLAGVFLVIFIVCVMVFVRISIKNYLKQIKFTISSNITEK